MTPSRDAVRHDGPDAGEAAAENAQRLAAEQIVRAAPGAMLLAWGAEPVIVAVSRSMADRLGPAAAPGRPLAAALAPHGDAIQRMIARKPSVAADDGETLEVGAAGGERLRVRLVPVGAAGGVAGILVTSAEADYPAAAVHETSHRLRNALGVIRSLVRRTAATSNSVEDFAMHLEGRIDALARVQTLGPAQLSAGIDLETLIAEEMAAAAIQEGRQLRIAGPPVRLQPQAAATLALAVHELATNALKFGALATGSGEVAVHWSVDARDRPPPLLVLDWEERGSPARPVIHRRGFGTDTMERTLTYQLQARATHVLYSDGLAWRIELPLTPRILTGPPALYAATT